MNWLLATGIFFMGFGFGLGTFALLALAVLDNTLGDVSHPVHTWPTDPKTGRPVT